MGDPLSLEEVKDVLGRIKDLPKSVTLSLGGMLVATENPAILRCRGRAG